MTIPFPTIRIVRPDFVLGLVVFGVLVLLGVLVVQQAYELRDLTAERNRLQSDRNLMERRCAFVVDGSAVCPPKTFTVGGR